MSTAIAERPVETPTVTEAQFAFMRRAGVIPQDATMAHVQLWAYDCARQGVEMLDRLLHCTIRKGKYVPVTSIDLMRIRAAESGEMAGSDEAVFVERGGENQPPIKATVTVYRLTQGQRFAYTGTALWSEYKPDDDWMWRKMPHGQLAKCAEALALRKGFPKQLHGLYAAEEMAQAGNRQYPVQASAPDLVTSTEEPDAGSPPPPTGDDSAASQPASQPIWKPAANGDAVVIDPKTGEEVPVVRPEGYHFVWDYKRRGPAHVATIRHWDNQGGSLEVSTIYDVGEDLKRAAVEHTPVRIQTAPKKPARPGEEYLQKLWFYNPDLKDLPF